MERRQIP